MVHQVVVLDMAVYTITHTINYTVIINHQIIIPLDSELVVVLAMVSAMAITNQCYHNTMHYITQHHTLTVGNGVGLQTQTVIIIISTQTHLTYIGVGLGDGRGLGAGVGEGYQNNTSSQTRTQIV